MAAGDTPRPSGTAGDRYLEDISADELYATHPRMRPTPTGTLDVNATESGTNDVDVSEKTYQSGTSQRLSTKSRVGCTLPRSNASCLSQR
jgi:hypothetical protein